MSRIAILGLAALATVAMPYHRFLGAPIVVFDPPDGRKTVAELATELKEEQAKAIKEAVDPLREKFEEFVGKAAKGEKLEALKTEVDESLTKMNAKLTEQFATLEQKLLEGGGGQPQREKSMGELFAEDPKVKEFLAQANPRGRIDLQAKTTLTSLTTAAGGSVGDAIQTTRLPGILPLPQRRMTVRDLLSQGQMDGSTLEYVKETGFTNNAGMVAEGAAKPSSDIQLDLVSTSAKVIAHYMKASRQVLSDISQLRSIIDQRLLYGLAYKEESQLLNGDNTGQNLNGIIPQATAYSAPVSLADLNIIDVLRLAMLQAALAEYPASGHVLHPTDWASIETLKDGEGRYIIGNPQGTTTPTLWGLPVVATQSITVRKFLTGAFKLGAQVFDRWAARVEVATENEDDFIKNLVTVLAEERVALAVYRPEAFIYGDFDTALAA
ncbi:MAG: Major capsid protein Gp5 [Devosia sp.]|uniref:phage major capsid protein n=1 Tax=Devosia sp. TaxID=1871048 RepID=UPI0026144822|nr:phage major capsid protein [Devosia sp.]MDB5540533.1 Major capsid protein Gp5 [Devosia sp.]